MQILRQLPNNAHFPFGTFQFASPDRWRHLWRWDGLVMITSITMIENTAPTNMSAPNRQNHFPLLLVKLRNTALKFLVHFSWVSQVCLAKYPKPHEKWLPIGQGIWGSISHPSAMLWRPLGIVFCKFCNQKGFSEAYSSVFTAFTNCQNPFPLQKSGKCNGKGFWPFVP